MKRRAALIVTSAALSVSVMLTGCNPGSSHPTYYKNGPAGMVVDRDAESDGTYELETKSLGHKHEFNVTYSVYLDCHKYQYYPSCVHDSKSLKSPKASKTKSTKKPWWKKSKKSTTKKTKRSWGFSSSKSKKRSR